MDSKYKKKYYEQAYELLESQNKILDHLVFSKLVNLSIKDITVEIGQIIRTLRELMNKPDLANSKIEDSKMKIIVNTLDLADYTVAYILKIKGVNIDKAKMSKEIVKKYNENTEEVLYYSIIELLTNNIKELQIFITDISNFNSNK